MAALLAVPFCLNAKPVSAEPKYVGATVQSPMDAVNLFDGKYSSKVEYSQRPRFAEYLEANFNSSLFRKDSGKSLQRKICLNELIEEQDFKLSLESLRYEFVPSQDPSFPTFISYVHARFRMTDKTTNSQSPVEVNKFIPGRFKANKKDIRMYMTNEGSPTEFLKCIHVKLHVK